MADPWLTLDPSELRHAITLLTPGPGPIGLAGATTAYVKFADTRAKYEPQDSIDLVQNGQATAQLAAKFTLRWRAGVHSAMRVQTDFGTFVIRSVRNVQNRNLVIVLNCIEVGRQS